MVSNRPHRQGKSMDVALRELEGLVPHQLDAAVFAALLKQRESIAGALKNLG
jgi:HD-GYP domain-containing protein (c-di-GMP phosphodiesterase class II)